MIRYDITETLEESVDKVASTWRGKAGALTQRMLADKKFIEELSWSAVKPVYRKLQWQKCGYCERRLPGPTHGASEHDIEHYRPKNALKPWKPGDTMGFSVKSGRAGGYYWLAYDLENYCTACSTCNGELKSNCFPIAGTPADRPGADVSDINAQEKPFLLYPLGKLDDDPEEALTFDGLLPKAVKANTRLGRRARVTIRFFKLDLREELLSERANILCQLWLAFRALADVDPEVAGNAAEELRLAQLPKSPHTNFARAYVKLFKTNPAKAYAHYRDALEYRREGKLR